MTPDALHKRAERQRRREAGEVRVEVWLRKDQIQALDWYCESAKKTRSDVIDAAIGDYLA